VGSGFRDEQGRDRLVSYVLTTGISTSRPVGRLTIWPDPRPLTAGQALIAAWVPCGEN